MAVFQWGPQGKKTRQLERFVANGIWELSPGKEKYKDAVLKVPIGSMLAAYISTKSKQGKFQIHVYALGEVTDNPGDGRRLKVDWRMLPEPVFFPTGAGYAWDISEVVDGANIRDIFWNLYPQTFPSLSSESTSNALWQSQPRNQILFGPPGTGKTYNAILKAVELVMGDGKPRTFREAKMIFDKKQADGQIGFVTFHQSLSYEDFVEGIRPVLLGERPLGLYDDGSGLTYELRDGIFKEICKRASGDESQRPTQHTITPDWGKPSSRPHVLIIDEINRGNVSQIFGELITLIEGSKRIGASEALRLTLPYSREPFGVPDNLFLIGTMNTADRSIEALDTALRRRFHFQEMAPQPELLRDKAIAGVSLQALLRTINRRLAQLLDKDHCIGHAFLLDCEDEEQLKAVFHRQILPLLQEFFYGDFAKIGLVLGKGFLEPLSWQGNWRLFADFDHDAAHEFTERKVWRIRDCTAADFDLTTALRLLQVHAEPGL